ncbi:MAG: hypothetical protein Q8O52_12625 [Sulfuritalea sp.]|nr:hypothetical protein [Sulfuritalea sp.]
MLLIDSDILIDATAVSHAIPLASKNQKHLRSIGGLELLPWPTITTP